MGGTVPLLGELVTTLQDAPRRQRRRLIALAGPPASGKSTLAGAIATALTARGCPTAVVPMDGYHLHNDTLVARGLLPCKGAPETFDAAGFVHLIGRLGTEGEVFYPTFDRQRDIAIANAGRVAPECDTVIVEGNYLLFDAPVWRDLQPMWDMALRLDVPLDELRARLVQRWLDHGLSPADAAQRAKGNDLANARRVQEAALPADMILTGIALPEG